MNGVVLCVVFDQGGARGAAQAMIADSKALRVEVADFPPGTPTSVAGLKALYGVAMLKKYLPEFHDLCVAATYPS